ncbi:MAG: energy transducer TonB [Deltaproteobacteria bacterium]|nr:energy transducer TonB [Deltaproteobacteria bacterium]
MSAQDSAAAVADSAAADSSKTAAAAVDSTAADTAMTPALGEIKIIPDSLSQLASSALKAEQQSKRVGDEIEALVIPWDWDDYTNVIEVGLKNLKNEREYSLTKNEEYQRLFNKFQGRRLKVWGRISRDSDGFYSMTVNWFEPTDSSATTAAAVQAPVAETVPRFKTIPPKPKIPPQIARAGVDAACKVEFFVTKTGDVDPARIKISASSGFPELDQIALEWVKQIKFEPAMNKGKPVGVLVAVPVEWKSK